MCRVPHFAIGPAAVRHASRRCHFDGSLVYLRVLRVLCQQQQPLLWKVASGRIPLCQIYSFHRQIEDLNHLSAWRSRHVVMN